MISRSVPLLLAALVVLQSSPSRAWGDEGHKIVCAIAWDELSPNALDRVETILGINSKEQFADACNWADEVRHLRPETSGWHFVNVPRDATTVDLVRDCGWPRSCVVVQIQTDAAALKETPSDPADRLKYVAHFVGDVHQPLHVSFEDDRGGNEIKGTFLKKPTNLHALWNSGLIESDGRSGQDIAQDLEASVTAKEREQWSASTPLDWANESLTIALAPDTKYAKHGDTFRLGAAYQKRNLPVLLERLKRAGVRLAATLNAALGTELER